jgi:hypothetical protein
VTVHIDRAHHHPRVYKRLGYWMACCPNCGLLRSSSILPLRAALFSLSWRHAYMTALYHAEKAHA